MPERSVRLLADHEHELPVRSVWLSWALGDSPPQLISMAQRFSLADKVCIVTGAASGIGLESVKSFLLAGAAGVCLVDRSAEALAAATTQLPKEALDANKVITAVADVTDPAANAAFVSKTVEVFGKLDVLMASAGVPSIPTPLDETAIETFDQIMAVNVRGGA